MFVMGQTFLPTTVMVDYRIFIAVANFFCFGGKMNIYLEIFGYIGTAFVITSMMMSSVLKLRLLNIVGSVISMIYAILCNTWPVVILNFCLATINVYKLLASARVRVVFRHIISRADDEAVGYFLLHYRQDIEKLFPEYDFDMSCVNEAHLVYAGAEMAGLLLGSRDGDAISVKLDYVAPAYRDRSVAGYLFGQLWYTGARKVYENQGSKQHNKYLEKTGFVMSDGVMVKELKEPVTQRKKK